MTLRGSQRPALMSLQNVCGVAKKTRLSRQKAARSAILPLPPLAPSMRAVSRSGMPTILKQAAICCVTSGLVGARKTTLPRGNHRQKFHMHTAAMKVLPSPVGSETSVFWNSAPLAISSW